MFTHLHYYHRCRRRYPQATKHQRVNDFSSPLHMCKDVNTYTPLSAQQNTESYIHINVFYCRRVPKVGTHPTKRTPETLKLLKATPTYNTTKLPGNPFECTTHPHKAYTSEINLKKAASSPLPSCIRRLLLFSFPCILPKVCHAVSNGYPLTYTIYKSPPFL